MALNDTELKQRLWLRAVGLSFGMAAGVGLVLALVGFTGLGVVLMIFTGLPGLLILGYEVTDAVGMVSGKRGSLGAQAVLQVLLAAALLVGVNALSFSWHGRYDWTRNKMFTLDPA